MTRPRTIATCLFVLLLSACRALTPGDPGSTEPGIASPSDASSSAAATAVPPAMSPGACGLGAGIAEYAYPGLRQFVGEFRGLSRGVAIAEVVSVGQVQYSTESGERPSCDELDAAPGMFSIGRIVEVRVLTPAGGAVEKGEVLSYLYQGGSLGRDSTPGHPFGLRTPTEGDRMLVLIAREPIDVDPSSGELGVDVLEMFLITPEGRIVTPDRAERVTVDRVASLLRDVLPSPVPGG